MGVGEQNELQEVSLSSDDIYALNRLKSEGIQTKDQIDDLFSGSLFFVLPTYITSRRDLTLSDKMVLGEIMALCRSRGYCTASNLHISNHLGVSKRTVNRAIKNLYKAELLDFKVKKNYGGLFRTIILNTNGIIGMKDKMSHTVDKMSLTVDKMSTPIYKEDSIEDSKDTPYNPPKGEGFDASRHFETAWNNYPKRIGKKQAFKHYKQSVKSLGDVSRCAAALETYKKSDEVRRGFIKHGSTWFNCWEDYVNSEPPKPIKESRESKLKRNVCPECNGGDKSIIKFWEEDKIYKCDYCMADHTIEINKLSTIQ